MTRFEKNMKKYKVEFEFRLEDYEISDGKWHKDCIDNNGVGFTFEDAERVAMDIRQGSVVDTRWIEVIEM